jgi:NADH:ubiquinone oxidoreductase subunit F (NADH-binding)/(2Fe-2S) ferredoxin
MHRLKNPADLKRLRQDIHARRSAAGPTIAICAGTGCLACGAAELRAAFEKELGFHNLRSSVEIRSTGCHGFCERGPIVVIMPQNITYLRTKPKDVPEIILETLIRNQTVERLLYQDPETGRRIARVDDIPFYKHQKRILMAQNVQIDATNVEDYIAIDGYAALARVLTEMKPDEVIALIKKSQLRGRGGGGFPTGVKWETSRKAHGSPKYVIVNGDEGDPGAYMDRSLLEGNPHSILEGLMIGGYAIGASEGYIYVRQEYPLAVKNAEIAIEQARARGLLGKDILGTGFDFDVVIHRGAGAFVSGESSALMNAIEGVIGEPRPKYIHTSDKGLWDKPTCLNNVETWANVPLIINNGADWFRSMGTEGSKGTKIFSLVGKVVNTGLVEVPMGISLRDIVFKIGGGVPRGKKFKAVQTGGPSGGVIPEKLLDLSVDFDELTNAGSMMGSGGMIVMDEDTCMVDTARYYTNFLAHEGCGKCIPCREGLRQMLRILNNITSGKGREGDIELLEEISEFMMEASLCALGRTAPNPVLSTIKYFRDEYEAHIREKRCPAHVCVDLIQYQIDPERCHGCRACVKACPTKAISGEPKKPQVIQIEKCIKCGSCLAACPDKFSAVTKVTAAAAVV